MRIKLLVISSVFVAGLFMVSRLSLAEDAVKPDAAAPAAITAPAEEMGNKICPISGEKIEAGTMKQVTYNGKVYNLCCGMCEKDFMKDPEAAIKKLESMAAMKEEMKEGGAMMEKMDDAKEKMEGK